MSSLSTILCISNSLVKKGLVELISSINPETELIFCDRIKEIYQYKDDKSLIIILDQKLIPNPCVYCLDKIKNAFQTCKLIAITEKKLPDNLGPYFEEIIYSSESETEITSKLIKIYGELETKKNQSSSNSQLSEREIEILRSVALGLTNKEIGDKLFISAHTVITHRKNITTKLGIKTIAGLTVFAILNGIISSDELTK